MNIRSFTTLKEAISNFRCKHNDKNNDHNHHHRNQRVKCKGSLVQLNSSTELLSTLSHSGASMMDFSPYLNFSAGNSCTTAWTKPFPKTNYELHVVFNSNKFFFHLRELSSRWPFYFCSFCFWICQSDTTQHTDGICSTIEWNED